MIPYVDDPTVPAGSPRDPIIHVFGSADAHEKFMEEFIGFWLPELESPEENAIACYTDQPMLLNIVSVDVVDLSIETEMDDPMEGVIHFGRVIRKPEGVNLPGELVVTSMDSSWEHPRLTATDVFPLEEIKGVRWVMPSTEYGGHGPVGWEKMREPSQILDQRELPYLRPPKD